MSDANTPITDQNIDDALDRMEQDGLIDRVVMPNKQGDPEEHIRLTSLGKLAAISLVMSRIDAQEGGKG